MSESWKATDSSFALLDPLTSREKDVLRLIVAGLSNREMAIQLFLTEGTVKWHNKHIFDKLGVRSRAEAIAKSHALGIIRESGSPLDEIKNSNLPYQPTTFVGRDNEIQSLITRLHDQDCRLITLTGMGGIGKTRLAIQAATLAQSGFNGGAYFVSLETVHSPDQVMSAIAQSCRLLVAGIQNPHQQLIDFLQHKALLLVLDNFEHLIQSKNDVLDILRQTQHVKIIITSRIPLQVREEWMMPISGMAFPDHENLEYPDQFDAIRLFHTCAKRAGADVSNESEHIRRICQMTQGMPLAIELAASWLRIFTCQEIIQNLSQNLDLTALPTQDLPDRHQSIRQIFEQSWGLLSETDQRILRALSIFRGGFTSSALHSVTDASINVLARFVDYSLVQVTGEGRYDLHPLIDHMLQERLQASGEFEAVTTVHAAFYAQFMNSQLENIKGKQQLIAIRDIRADIKNIVSAWQWLIARQDYDTISKMWEALVIYMDISQDQQLLNVYESVHVFRLPKAPIHPAQVYLIFIQCAFGDDANYAEEAAQQALQVAEHFRDKRATAFAFYAIGFTHSFKNNPAKAVPYIEKSLTLFRQLGDNYSVTIVLNELGFNYGLLGKKAESNATSQERYKICRSTNNQFGLVTSLHSMGGQAFFAGDYAVADDYMQEALAIAREFNNWLMIVHTTGTLGLLRILIGDFDDAHQFIQQTIAAAKIMGGEYPKTFSFLLGILANTRGDYLHADLLFSDARILIAINPFMMMLVNWGHAVAQYGLHHFETSIEYVQAVLRTALPADTVTMMTLSLPAAALLLWHENHKAFAVECMALWFTHPMSQQGWFLRSPLGNNVMDNMKTEIGEAAFDQAWQTGTTRDLIVTASELLNYLS
jgi:predicted ATPase/DNA-binding CsgD family transcriptional regulator